MRRRHALALIGSALAAPAVHAQSLTNVRFTLDWALQGPQGAFVLALDKGYFREAGLNVTMDRGFGSGDVPVKISAGAYDVGVADLSPTIRMKLERPESDLFTPFILHDATALAVMTLRRENIRTPADLVGKTLAAPESDAGRQLFPAFAKAAGFDPASVRWQSVTPQLREPMLAQGRVNAITGFITSGIFSLRGLGVAEQDIVTMLFSDVGANFFATSLITTRRWAAANPQAVTGLIRGLVRAQYDSLRDPDATIANLRRREPLTDVALETERLRMALDRLTFTPHVRQNGFGQVDMARLQRNIDAVREAFGISRPLPASDIYDPSYLPPAADLRQS
ncbi:ABC transporter substrate-binding protein [Falsiroseomonas tokyonensis]|uniref:Thiamine pyrimidine synthase n=1 Tax=Falsiroseomonas tokyonensis TaxID=430521 RepID=A0ABV7BR62_9PROT|nr:ABC transporter substrate-binding protein [Falsiroseomonas tokyonensis]MBU8537720.1 ABC transporter substrate-binding protein [Falsiroseomonas tokyonensis]